MERVNASDAKREFGELLLKVQQSPVGIDRNGKPIAVIVSTAEYAEIERMKVTRLKSAIREGLADLNAGNMRQGKEVFEELRKRV